MGSGSVNRIVKRNNRNASVSGSEEKGSMNSSIFLKTIHKRRNLWLLSIICCYPLCLGAEDAVAKRNDGAGADSRDTMTFHDGSTYAGEFKEGEPHGRGIIAFADGSSYVGAFRAGEMHGHGTMSFPDGSEYVGEFKEGMLWGRGVMTFPDGSRYEGFFKNDTYHGRGVWVSPFGIRYEGQFKEGQFDGQGTCVLPDGYEYIGDFRNDCFLGPVTEGNDTGPIAGTEDSLEVNNTDSDSPLDHDDAVVGTSELAFSVQVGAFLSKGNAEKLAALLRDKGYETQLAVMRDVAGQPWYAVRLGKDFASLEEAQARAAVFVEKENMAAIVRPVDSL